MINRPECINCRGTTFVRTKQGNRICAQCHVGVSEITFENEFREFGRKGLTRASVVESKKERKKKEQFENDFENHFQTNWIYYLDIFQTYLMMTVQSYSQYLNEEHSSSLDIALFQKHVKAYWFKYLQVWKESGKPLVAFFTFAVCGKFKSTFEGVKKSNCFLSELTSHRLTESEFKPQKVKINYESIFNEPCSIANDSDLTVVESNTIQIEDNESQIQKRKDFYSLRKRKKKTLLKNDNPKATSRRGSRRLSNDSLAPQTSGEISTDDIINTLKTFMYSKDIESFWNYFAKIATYLNEYKLKKAIEIYVVMQKNILSGSDDYSCMVTTAKSGVSLISRTLIETILNSSNIYFEDTLVHLPTLSGLAFLSGYKKYVMRWPKEDGALAVDDLLELDAPHPCVEKLISSLKMHLHKNKEESNNSEGLADAKVFPLDVSLIYVLIYTSLKQMFIAFNSKDVDILNKFMNMNYQKIKETSKLDLKLDLFQPRHIMKMASLVQIHKRFLTFIRELPESTDKESVVDALWYSLLNLICSVHGDNSDDVGLRNLQKYSKRVLILIANVRNWNDDQSLQPQFIVFTAYLVSIKMLYGLKDEDSIIHLLNRKSSLAKLPEDTRNVLSQVTDNIEYPQLKRLVDDWKIFISENKFHDQTRLNDYNDLLRLTLNDIEQIVNKLDDDANTKINENFDNPADFKIPYAEYAEKMIIIREEPKIENKTKIFSKALREEIDFIVESKDELEQVEIPKPSRNYYIINDTQQIPKDVIPKSLCFFIECGCLYLETEPNKILYALKTVESILCLI